MKGGYVMVDVKGTDLYTNGNRTVDASIYPALIEARKTGKPIVLVNSIRGANSPATPIVAYSYDAPISATTVFLIVGNKQVQFTSNNSMTVTAIS